MHYLLTLCLSSQRQRLATLFFWWWHNADARMFSCDRYKNNSEIDTWKCFFWHLRTELNGGVMIPFVTPDE